MKIVLFCGNAANQKALANKIHKEFNLSAMVVVNKVKKRNWNFASNWSKRNINNAALFSKSIFHGNYWNNYRIFY